MGLIPELGTYPGEGNGNPLQYSCLVNPMGRGALWAYSPCGRKESNMTEHTHISSKTNIWEDWERTTFKAKDTGSPGQETSQVDYSH